MGQQVARIGDQGQGICYAHSSPRPFTTTFVSGDETVNLNEKQMCTIGTLGVTSCGHRTMATTGSSTVFGTDGKAVHRVGDTGIVIEGGTYVVVSGSSDVFAGD